MRTKYSILDQQANVYVEKGILTRWRLDDNELSNEFKNAKREKRVLTDIELAYIKNLNHAVIETEDKIYVYNFSGLIAVTV